MRTLCPEPGDSTRCCRLRIVHPQGHVQALKMTRLPAVLANGGGYLDNACALPGRMSMLSMWRCSIMMRTELAH